MVKKVKCESCNNPYRSVSLRISIRSHKRLCFKCFNKESSEHKKGNFKYDVSEDKERLLILAKKRNAVGILR